MGKCPFCAEAVSEELLLFGGTCPKCFGQIPGEEVATHPGFEVIAQQAAQDDRRSTFKTMIPLLAAVPVLGGVAALAIGIVVWNQDPVIEPLDFDEMGEMEFNIVAAPPEEPVEEPKPKTGPRKSNGTKAPAEPKPQPIAAVMPDAPKPAGSAGPPNLSNMFNNDFVQVKRDGVELTDDTQIATMIRKALQQQSSSLTTCYNQALTRRADLAGRWRMSFVVSKTGYAENITFTGRNIEDAEMEQCLVRTVAKWSFGKIAHVQPVQKTYNFGVKN